MNARPTLTILVPTYNRAAYLENLMDGLCKMVEASHHRDRVEILISDNVSRDRTPEIGTRFGSLYSFVTYHRKQMHLDSGEANIFSSAPLAHGEYVWTLGDDDFVLPGAVDRLFQVLDGNDAAFFLFNNGVVDSGRHTILDHYIESSHSMITFDTISDLVANLGFITATTTFSSTVWSKRAILRADWQDLVRASSAYAHVAIYLDGCRGLKSAFVDRHLIAYRFVEGEIDRSFSRWAKEHKLPRLFPWHIGIIRLFNLLIKKGNITPDYFWSIKELIMDFCAIKGNIRPLHFLVCEAFIKQIKFGLSSLCPSEFIDLSAWLEAMTFFKDCPFPEERSVIERLASLTPEMKSLAESAWSPRACPNRIARKQAFFRQKLQILQDVLGSLDKKSGCALPPEGIWIGLAGSNHTFQPLNCRGHDV